MPNVRESMIHDDAVTAAKIKDGAVSGSALASGSVTEAKLGTAAVTSTKIAESAVAPFNVANTATSGVGMAYTVTIAVPDAAGDVDVTIPYKSEVIDVQTLKRGGAGGAGDTLTIKNLATAITNAISLNTADNTRTHATTIDDATSTISAAGTLRATAAKASDCECTVIVTLVRRA